MSYCRFGDDNWKCNVYAYASGFGYQVHVGTHKFDCDIPELPDEESDGYASALQVVRAALDSAKRVPIGGKHDGKSYQYATLAALLRGLKDIRKDGYHIQI